MRLLRAAISSLAACGCSQNEITNRPVAAKSRQGRQAERLDTKSARKALIAMLERHDAPDFDTRSGEIRALKNGKNFVVMEKGAEGILSGYWNCDLSKKKFSFLTPIGSCEYNCYGVFERADGHWQAKVKGTSWAHFEPNDSR
jgi:hypothetical protein